jgi:hypothetical protein
VTVEGKGWLGCVLTRHVIVASPNQHTIADIKLIVIITNIPGQRLSSGHRCSTHKTEGEKQENSSFHSNKKVEEKVVKVIWRPAPNTSDVDTKKVDSS